MTKEKEKIIETVVGCLMVGIHRKHLCPFTAVRFVRNYGCFGLKRQFNGLLNCVHLKNLPA
ncbi:MAG TPA: hypothetical protein VMW72_14155 [Sedimentisphaerales bacterium]|nr:hypothetical protein [Sedimentisphaerales bacterium]